ncbi:MAG: N-acetyl-gamma-glutamyl-phosphate reductase [Candidatus Omnitrophica bacterium]|nr:N-acetyl-gamma-glutamyl-phosphate reductase [Candidatus Omnitrophota bacterium]
MLNVGIAGATGYTGQELVDILLRHPHVRLTGLYSTTDEPRAYAAVFPRFANRTALELKKLDVKALAKNSDAVFLALPHTTAMDVAPYLLRAKKTVIDLSADYRLADTAVYKAAYQVAHKDKANIKRAVYGLPEIYRQKIGTAQLIANPGCYPTAAILGLAPLLATDSVDLSSVIIDAKSGTTGAGKKAVFESLFSEVDEDFKAYKVNTHQHMPEIAQELSKLAGKKVPVTFVPHLLPLKRGILETIYVRSKKGTSLNPKQVVSLYRKFYKNEPFVRIRQYGVFPCLKDVAGTNFCDIGVKADGASVIIISAIDNLLKGASGQAVQNMNIRYQFPETAGLV